MRISDWSSDVCSSDLSENILIDDAISIGASDAGIYVGQTNTAIIRNSLSRYNVFGFEIENVRGGEYDGNLAECNTGGFLIYDLDNLRQYGERSVMKNNISRKNNTYNFTAGGFVGNVPAGSRSEEHTSQLQSLMRISY